MVSEKPPRHSRPKNDPVTIDLEARKDTSNAAVDGPSDGSLAADQAPAGEAGISPAPDTTDTASGAEAANVGTIADEMPLGSDEQETLPPVTEPEPASTHEPESTPTAPAAPAPRSPTFASLAAVGILGGLVALAGAGALQYGGILPAIGPQQQTAADTSALSSDIASLKAEIARISTTTPAAADKALEVRLAELEAAMEEIRAAPQPAASEALAALQAALTRSTEEITAIRAELAATQQSLSDSRGAIETRLTEAETKLDEPRNDISMAHAIAVAALKTAIDRGGPFLGELNTLAGVSPQDPAVAALQPHAAVGIPSRADLVRRFPATADAILAAINQPDPDQGWGDRLIASAMSVVKVRPVGNVEGETPEAIVARIEDKLQNGDLKGAALEWQNLPDAGKAASSDFEKALQTRIEVETIVSTALTSAVDGKG